MVAECTLPGAPAKFIGTQPGFGSVPAPLPSAQTCPRAMVSRAVVPHPAGGYTHALPRDATQSTVRDYRGWWATRRAARLAHDIF